MGMKIDTRGSGLTSPQLRCFIDDCLLYCIQFHAHARNNVERSQLTSAKSIESPHVKTSLVGLNHVPTRLPHTGRRAALGKALGASTQLQLFSTAHSRQPTTPRSQTADNALAHRYQRSLPYPYTTMLDIHKPPPSSDTKTYFSHSILPSYIDPLNTSTKKKPFTAFNNQPHSHTLDLVLPAEIWNLVRAHLASHNERVYARAFLKLSDILEEEFLDAYIRNGNVSMLSEGRPLVDTRFEIVEGVLKIEFDRPTYERAGLVGVPLEDGGKKHQRNRWLVEYDLKQGSMKKGKKGFERLKWAAKNVLNDSKSWLFWSANPTFAESVKDGQEVLSKHVPKVFALEPEITALKGVVVPKLDVQENGLSGLYDQEDALALLEWLDMVNLGSSRVTEGDEVNSHICRYDVPDFGHGVETQELVRVRWSGFITPGFVKDLFLGVWKAGFKGKHEPKRRKGNGAHDVQEEDVTMEGTQVEADAGKWFSMSAHAFGSRNAWSLMQFASRETLVWEVED